MSLFSDLLSKAQEAERLLAQEGETVKDQVTTIVKDLVTTLKTEVDKEVGAVESDVKTDTATAEADVQKSSDLAG